jgi:hypothetical protein
MKKLLAIAVVVGLAGAASAASVGFEYGVNFFKPAVAGAQAKEGQNLLLNWNLDNDIALGIYTELTNLVGILPLVAGDTLAVSAIQVTKGVIKNVVVGLNLGAGKVSANAAATLVDVFGEVTMLSGTGEKVTGSLKGVVSARFAKNTVPCSMDGYNLGIALGVAF